MLALLVACVSPDPHGGRKGEPPVDPTPPTTDTVTPPPTTPPTEPTTPPTAPCAADPALELAVEVDQPWHENEARVTVSLSAPASVAVACTLASDPEEVHLVEDADVTTEHELRLSGLLASESYECAAAAVCPATVAPAEFTLATGDAPSGFVEVEATDYGGAGSEYVLFNQSRDCDYEYQRLVVVDREGRVRWWYTTPDWVGPSVEFRYHGGDQFEWGGGWDPNPLGRPRQVDLYDGELFDGAVALPDADGSDFHHDGKQLPDGRLLTLERVDIDNGFSTFDGFRVRRIDPATATVDFDWHSQQALDEGWLPAGFGDPWHANWVDIVDETLYVSLCAAWRVMAVDVASGDILWTWGEDGEFSLYDTNGEALPSSQFSQCQHGIEYTADDHLLVYDNGDNRGYSRITEYELDPANLEATLLWTWTEDDWWETTLGDADYLPDGRILVNAGHSDCFSSNPGDRTTILEFDPVTGEKLWQLRYVPQNMTAYRADWADPCDLFANARYCPELGERVAELAPVLSP